MVKIADNLLSRDNERLKLINVISQRSNEFLFSDLNQLISFNWPSNITFAGKKFSKPDFALRPSDSTSSPLISSHFFPT